MDWNTLRTVIRKPTLAVRKNKQVRINPPWLKTKASWCCHKANSRIPKSTKKAKTVTLANRKKSTLPLNRITPVKDLKSKNPRAKTAILAPNRPAIMGAGSTLSVKKYLTHCEKAKATATKNKSTKKMDHFDKNRSE